MWPFPFFFTLNFSTTGNARLSYSDSSIPLSPFFSGKGVSSGSFFELSSSNCTRFQPIIVASIGLFQSSDMLLRFERGRLEDEQRRNLRPNFTLFHPLPPVKIRGERYVKCPSGIFVLNLVPSDIFLAGWPLWHLEDQRSGRKKKDSTATKYKTFDQRRTAELILTCSTCESIADVTGFAGTFSAIRSVSAVRINTAAAVIIGTRVYAYTHSRHSQD